MHDEHGRLDILHNHDGVQVAGGLGDIDGTQFDGSCAVNVHAQFAACRVAMPIMRVQGRGVILNTASNAGVFSIRG